MSRRKVSNADVNRRRDEILDDIDDEISALPAGVRELLLTELCECLVMRANDIGGYYGKRRKRG